MRILQELSEQNPMTSYLPILTHSNPEFGINSFRFWYGTSEHNPHSKDQIHAKNPNRHITVYRPMCRRIHHRKSRSGQEIKELLVELSGRSDRPSERTRWALRASNHQRVGGLSQIVKQIESGVDCQKDIE